MKRFNSILFFGSFIFHIVLGCGDGVSSAEKPPTLTSETPLKQHERYLDEISKLPRRKHRDPLQGMIQIKGGAFLMGGVSSQARPDEFPRHSETVTTFWMDKTEVTNAQFKEFVAATGYVTTAERDIELQGQTYDPGALVFDSTNPQQWWRFQKGANWKHPYGPESSIAGKEDHPVVQVSWYDATAYAHWVGKRLPTEVEWEYAARGGEKGHVYFWGNNFEVATQYANFHQGNFPVENTRKDNYEKTAAVGTFPSNAFGLHDMAGNVWEWCLDTYHPNAYEMLHRRLEGYFKNYLNPDQQKVMRGGSFLCSESYCTGYRASARMSSTPDTGLEHTGFRLVYAE
ncbi:MAG: formylglycine-generating enzyme family protein [Bacteroidota bacterium]